MSLTISKKNYANLFGPTTGDKVRLGDTELFIEIEKDHNTYGDESKFGGGKSIRDGMGQSSTATRDQGVLDLVITGAIIVDHWGIEKADIGIKDGNIVEVIARSFRDKQGALKSPKLIKLFKHNVF